jgi:hypothetical protein
MYRTLAFALGLALLSGCGGVRTTPDPGTPYMGASGRGTAPHGAESKFTVSGRYIDLNGKHFFVKGIDYWPTPIDTKPWDAPGLNDALRNGNSAIWMRDLPLMRKMGANAIRVYNVVPPPYDSGTGPISDFLNAAWNNGDHPIYVLMTVHFAAEKLLDAGAVNALANQYRDLDKKYASYPAVMGTTMSNEIMGAAYTGNPQWWKGFNTVAAAAKQGFAEGGNPEKLVITADYDPGDNAAYVRAGERNNAAIDAWGFNTFRGRTFTGLYPLIEQTTKKPVLLTEYSAPASHHPELKNTYSWKTGAWPEGIGSCSPTTPDGPLNQKAAVLPEAGNPKMAGLIDYITNNASLLYSGYKDNGIVSGGFVLEWSDEWWKAAGGNASVHLGNPTFTGHFPGCTYDEAWFGLNAVSKGTGTLDVLTPRPTLEALEHTWSTEP